MADYHRDDDNGDVDDIGGSTSHHSSRSSSTVKDVEAMEMVSDENGETTRPTEYKCCNFLFFGGCKEAQGYALLGTARGAVVMSNIFLSTSLIWLASSEAGCLQENEDTGKEEIIDDCEYKVYGFKPISLIANIAVISGLMSAFLMPIIGAIIDYTPHRWRCGVLSAILIVLIQATQIGTVQATWFPMAILQAIAGFLYQVQVLASYAYLPEIARSVGQMAMTKFTAIFTMMQFTAQATFLIVVIVFSIALSLNNVTTAMVSQAINTVWVSLGFWSGWRLLPKPPSKHTLGEGQSLVLQGFKQTWRTAKAIHQHYPHGLRWFLLATVFAEAGANAFTVVSVVYLSDHLDMSGTEIGIVFLITLLATVPGSKVGSIVTRKTNPNTSWKLCLAAFSIATIAGAFALNGPERSYLAYVFAVLWGFILGWFYPTENLFFSLCLPQGQEAELTGFFVYCTQILVWLPPLLFTLLIENGVSQHLGLMSLVIFFVIAIGLLSLVAPWDEVLAEAAKNRESTSIQAASE